MLRRFVLALALGSVALVPLRAWAAEAFTDPAKAGPDYGVQGEYQGKLGEGDQALRPSAAQIIALGDGKFHGVFYFGGLPGDGWNRGDMQVAVDSTTEGGAIVFMGDQGSAKVDGGKLVIIDAGGTELGKLEKIERKKPDARRQAARGRQGVVRRHQRDAVARRQDRRGQFAAGRHPLQGRLPGFHAPHRVPHAVRAQGKWPRSRQ